MARGWIYVAMNPGMPAGCVAVGTTVEVTYEERIRAVSGLTYAFAERGSAWTIIVFGVSDVGAAERMLQEHFADYRAGRARGVFRLHAQRAIHMIKGIAREWPLVRKPLGPTFALPPSGEVIDVTYFGAVDTNGNFQISGRDFHFEEDELSATQAICVQGLDEREGNYWVYARSVFKTGPSRSLDACRFRVELFAEFELCKIEPGNPVGDRQYPKIAVDGGEQDSGSNRPAGLWNIEHSRMRALWSGAECILHFGDTHFVIDHKPLSIGRGSGVSLLVADTGVSRRHATFYLEDGVPYVKDEGSANGVFVNGKRIKGCLALTPGAEITLSECHLRIDRKVPDLASGMQGHSHQLLEDDMAQIGATLGRRYKLNARVLGPNVIKPMFWRDPEFDMYDAAHTALGGPLTVKLLTIKEQRLMPEARTMLLREGRVLQSLSHPQIIKAVDFDDTDAGETYLVMERFPALTLDAYLKNEAIDEGKILHFASDLAILLREIHAAGIVHGRLRAPDIHVEVKEGLPYAKLCVFTDAVNTEDPHTRAAVTMPSQTPWMSPEQASGAAMDARSDLYSFGYLLLTMLGHRGLPDAAPLKVGATVTTAEARQMVGMTTSYPSPLDPIWKKLLASDPRDRHVNTDELLEDLGTHLLKRIVNGAMN